MISLQEVLSLYALGTQLESVLEAYQESLGGNSEGVPRELLAAATPMVGELRSLHLPGPADAVAEHGFEDEGWTSEQLAPGSNTAKPAAQTLDHSCAIIDSAMQEVTPLRLWNMAMQKYEVLQGLQEQHEQAKGNPHFFTFK